MSGPLLLLPEEGILMTELIQIMVTENILDFLNLHLNNLKIIKQINFILLLKVFRSRRIRSMFLKAVNVSRNIQYLSSFFPICAAFLLTNTDSGKKYAFKRPCLSLIYSGTR